VVAFDTESQAIARAIIKRGDKMAYLIINISMHKTGFYVVEDEVVQFSTTINSGAGEDDFFLSLTHLQEEMRKVLSFWEARGETKTEGTEKKIKRALICGTGADQQEFIHKLMEESGVEYKIANVSMKPFASTPDCAAVVGLVIPPNK
jgi:Tfp pilus assembly PilM family ATPase